MKPKHALSTLAALVVAVACGSEPRNGFTETNAVNPELGGPSLPPGACVDGKTCLGNDVYTCDEEGNVGTFVTSCDSTAEFCFNGECGASCAHAEAWGSNVGCEFWAVDLDNEYSQLNDAAGQPWGVVVSNFGKTPAKVVIEVNDAPVGQPLKLFTVVTETIAPGTLKEITLPAREVDGSTQANNGPGTMLSSNAFRITSDVPVVVYQFNTLTHAFSNDASLLVPKNGLGTVYRVLGWPTANPISIGLQIPGIPDHSYVTIVGTQPDTQVTVKLAGPILGGGGIAAGGKGGVLTHTIGPFDVMNLESTGIPGDLTGTIVESTKPVVVFTGGERGIAPMSDGLPKPPGYDPQQGHCCTDHLEEQLLPVTSYGKSFVVTRSPIRSKGGYVEPDILRFMGVATTTKVKTSLPPPNDEFELQPGEVRDTWTQTDIVVEATEPLVIAQVLVSQGFTDNSGGEGGDPSLTIFPPVDQYRRDYLFNVPTSWSTNYVVISAPVSATVSIDGNVPADCVVAPAGKVAGVDYEARRCKVTEGAHRMTGDAPFGIVAYGYGSRGSYAFVGGANVKRIYEPPPLPPVK